MSYLFILHTHVTLSFNLELPVFNFAVYILCSPDAFGVINYDDADDDDDNSLIVRLCRHSDSESSRRHTSLRTETSTDSSVIAFTYFIVVLDPF